MPLGEGGPWGPEAFREDLQRSLNLGRHLNAGEDLEGGNVRTRGGQCLEEAGRPAHRAAENKTKNLLTLRLTLEQSRFELCGSTYKWIFFNSKYFRTAWSMIG